MANKINLFLDDERKPVDAYPHTHDLSYLMQPWYQVKTYDQFTRVITELYTQHSTLPFIISFDHDLDNEHYEYLNHPIPYETFKIKTGLHCAEWLYHFCKENNVDIPVWKIHTQNPAGGENIIKMLQYGKL